MVMPVLTRLRPGGKGARTGASAIVAHRRVALVCQPGPIIEKLSNVS